MNDTKKKHIFLSLIVLFHFLITIAIFSFIILTSLNIDAPILNFIVIGSVFSFFIFRRCIYIDIFLNIIKDENHDELPNYTKDNYYRNLIRNILNKEENESNDLTHLRLDILNNTRPFTESELQHEIDERYNYKLHYIVINIILIVMLLYKFKLVQYLPLLLVWLFTVFSI